jgi:hypothetical protein
VEAQPKRRRVTFYPRLFDRCAQLFELSVWSLRRPILASLGSLCSAALIRGLSEKLPLSIPAQQLTRILRFSFDFPICRLKSHIFVTNFHGQPKQESFPATPKTTPTT